MSHVEPDTMPNDSPVWYPQGGPPTNQWAPSDDPHNTWGVAEPSHGDVSNADPMSDDLGNPESTDGGGSTPDARMNLLSSVQQGGIVVPPTNVVHHIMETVETGAEMVRVRTVSVQGNVTPTAILEQNPLRRRALLQIVPASTTLAQTTIQTSPPNGTATVNLGLTGPNAPGYVRSLWVVLTTSAVVANRIVTLAMLDETGLIIAQVTCPTAQAASQSITYVFTSAITAPSNAVSAGGAATFVSQNPIPYNGKYDDGAVLSFRVANMDAGDSYTTPINLSIDALADTIAPIWVAPRAMGAGASAPTAWWNLRPEDGPLEVKSQDGIDGICQNATDSVRVQVYEELIGPKPMQPGLT